MLTAALPGDTIRRLGRRESVALLAMLMALNALGIDMMVPALPAIGASFHVADANRLQLVIIAYMIGFGGGQLLWGPLADRFGRKPVLGWGVGLFAVATIGCTLAPSFTLLIAGRAAMGAAAASTRVLVTAAVRDLFEGEDMARVMSLVFMVFMVVPVLAPSLGSVILTVGPWRTIFWVLAAIAGLLLLWGELRLPETLHPDYQRPLDPRAILAAMRAVVSDRLAVGYTLTATALFGGLSAYIATVQQIVADVFHAGPRLPLVFAAVAGPMALAAWGNSAIIGRLGLRRVGHGALLLFLALILLHLAVAASGRETLTLFVVIHAATLMSFAFCSSNFSTLAMTNMGAIAGTAASVQGVVSTIGGALIGLAIGQAFDGTVLPFLIGLAVTAIAATGCVLVTERGRLMAALDA